MSLLLKSNRAKGSSFAICWALVAAVIALSLQIKVESTLRHGEDTKKAIHSTSAEIFQPFRSTSHEPRELHLITTVVQWHHGLPASFLTHPRQTILPVLVAIGSNSIRAPPRYLPSLL